MDDQKQSKTHQNENDDRQYHRQVCLQQMHRVQLTSYRVLCNSFVFKQVSVNSQKALKQLCGHESINEFTMTTKMHNLRTH